MFKLYPRFSQKNISGLLSLILILNFHIKGVAQCDQVSWSNPKPTGVDLNDVKYASAAIAFAVGQYGTIVKTSDGGSSWTTQQSNTYKRLTSVFPVSSTTIYAAGDNGTILKTSNGGSTWASANAGISNLVSITTIQFPSADTGYAAGNLDANSGSAFVLYRTYNGATTWTQVSTSYLPASVWYVSDMYFTNNSTGYVVSAGNVYKTINRGDTFTQLNTDVNNSYNTVTFLNPNTGFIGGVPFSGGPSVVISKTNDGGLTWTNASANIGDFSLNVYAMDFPSATTGYAIVSHKKSYIIKTTDGGVTWSIVYQTTGFNSFGELNALDFTSNSDGLSVGTLGRILKTNDGTNFTDVSTLWRNNLNSIHFPSANTGYAVGDSLILKTTDNGATWTSLALGASTTYFGTYFTDNNTGYAVGSGGTIIKTTDGGITWITQISHTTFTFFAVRFTNANTGYATGVGGTMVKTTNGGSNWIVINSGTTLDISSIDFVDAQTGYFTTYNSGTGNPQIWKTTNAGANWTQIYSDVNSFYSVDFPDALHGYVGAFGGFIYKTIDGGISWQKLNTGYPDYQVRSLDFKDANNGLAALGKIVGTLQVRSSYGLILKTNDGGLTWARLDTIIYPELNSIKFSDANTAFAAGESATIIKVDLGLPSPLGPISGSDTLCTSSSVYSVGNVAGITYQWAVSNGGAISGTGNSVSLNWTTSGLHTLTVTPTNTCGSGAASVLNVFVSGAAPLEPDTIYGSTQVCLNASRHYNVTNIAGTTYSWSISGGGTLITNGASADIAWNTAGTYVLSVTATNSCGTSPAENLTINVSLGSFAQPSIIVGSDTVCAGLTDVYSVINDPSVLSYSWGFIGNPGGTITGTGNAARVSFGNSGMYNLAVTPFYACGEGTARSILILVNNAVALPNINDGEGKYVDLDGNETVCVGSTEIYFIEWPDSLMYTWNLSGGGSLTNYGDSISVAWNTAGTYRIIASAVNGCGIVGADTMYVVVSSMVPNVTGNILCTAAACDGGFASFSAPYFSNVSYDWVLSAGGSISSCDSGRVMWEHPGTFTVTATSVNGCGAGNSLNYSVAVDSIPTPVITVLGNTLSSNSISGNEWYYNGLLLTNTTGQTCNAIQNGWYRLRVNSNGCFSAFADSIEVIGVTGIVKTSLLGQFDIYPNPNTGTFILKFAQQGNYNLKMINVLGEQLWLGVALELENNVKIPEGLKGVFYLQIYSEQGMFIQKIFIE